MYTIRTHIPIENRSDEIKTMKDSVYKTITFAPGEIKEIPIQAWCRHRRRCKDWAAISFQVGTMGGAKRLSPVSRTATSRSAEYDYAVDLEQRELPMTKVRKTPVRRSKAGGTE